mgnify:CR=1 FL=1
MEWLESAKNQFSQTSSLEFWGVGLNFAAVLLTMRASRWNFPVGVVACLLFFELFLQYKLYADAVLQIFFLVLVFYGWWNWLRPKSHNAELPVRAELPIRRAPRLVLAVSLFGAAIFGGAWGYGLERFTDASVPFFDAQIAAFSVVAQWMIARKWLENWLVWIGVDILATGVFWHKDLKFTALLYALFTVMAIFGFLRWRKLMDNSPTAVQST